VTHDVDEALLLTDRIVLMTNGPAATVGEIVAVAFPRPRDRLQIVDDPLYERVRSQLITFLEERATPRPISLLEKRKEEAQTSPTAEELFVIEKYTGFNRFRSKYRRRQAVVEPIEIGSQARDVL
jgi:nitrate/nitrite transport system ATP-binding protein